MWRICLDNINNLGFFSNKTDLDENRPKILGVNLSDMKTDRRSEILICSQLSESLQWEGMPSTEQWLISMIDKIRRYSSRKIVIRSHPRSSTRLELKDVRLETPKKILGTYDDYDIDYNYHCVINHNSGPCVQSAIFGTPIICDQSSLAWPVSDCFENLENISLPDRSKWFLELCHTEWTVPEIASGVPFRRIFEKIS